MRSAIVVTLAVSVACVGNRPPTSPVVEPTCAASRGDGVEWRRTAPLREVGSLDRWCEAVGPPSRIDARRGEERFDGSFAVVTWNTHIGAGDLDALVADLQSSRLTGGRPVTTFVLLLQEAYRSGDPVPARDEIVAAARRLRLNAIYVPSMRNGRPETARGDRGNAILSTLPLSGVTAIELPLERQRRVAIEATITLPPEGGTTLPLHVVTAHLTNMVMHHLWLFSEPGRNRQAHALARALSRDGAMIIGGDFNTWFGVRDAAYRALAAGMRPAAPDDRRPTFGPMRLDHLLFRLPDGWRATVRRAASRYGSDHHALVALIETR